jgi:YesN/AraC family two-component response regulator
MEQGLKVICEAKDGIAAVEMIRKDKPDILILDCLTEKTQLH